MLNLVNQLHLYLFFLPLSLSLPLCLCLCIVFTCRFPSCFALWPSSPPPPSLLCPVWNRIKLQSCFFYLPYPLEVTLQRTMGDFFSLCMPTTATPVPHIHMCLHHTHKRTYSIHTPQRSSLKCESPALSDSKKGWKKEWRHLLLFVWCFKLLQLMFLSRKEAQTSKHILCALFESSHWLY